jgi:hypothetical protein
LKITKRYVSLKLSPNYLPVLIGGRPPKRYIPEDGISKEVTYSIAYYTSTKTLSKPLQNFAEQLSSVTILEKVEDALKSEKWTKAMSVEIEALEKKGYMGNG